MAKIKVTILGVGNLKKDNDRRLHRLTIGMTKYLLYLTGYSAKHFLEGPYPTHLSHKFGKSILARSLPTAIKIVVGRNAITGIVGVTPNTYYGLVWESRKRMGQSFENGHPKYRPFIRPAYEQTRHKWKMYIVEEFFNDKA